MKETIGWIGVGSMGHRMSRHLVEAGYPVVVADAVSTERAPPGATVAKSNAEVARQADIIILSLPDGNISQAVAKEIAATAAAAGEDGDRHLHHRHQGRRRPSAATLGAAGIDFIDAPGVGRHGRRRQGHARHHAGLPGSGVRARSSPDEPDGQAVPRRRRSRARVRPSSC